MNQRLCIINAVLLILTILALVNAETIAKESCDCDGEPKTPTISKPPPSYESPPQQPPIEKPPPQLPPVQKPPPQLPPYDNPPPQLPPIQKPPPQLPPYENPPHQLPPAPKTKPPQPPHGEPGSPATCPIDVARIGVCLPLLDGILGHGLTQSDECCSLLLGLVGLDVEVCLCAAIDANILGLINIDIKLDVIVSILSACNCQVPPNLSCPA